MANAGVMQKGVPITIDTAVAAPAAGNTFEVLDHPAGNEFSAVFQPIGTLTTLVAALQCSLDGGTTWTDFITSANFWPSAATVAVRVNLIAGPLYRINYTTASGAITARACCN